MSKFKSLVDTSIKDAEAQVSDYWKDINIVDMCHIFKKEEMLLFHMVHMILNLKIIQIML